MSDSVIELTVSDSSISGNREVYFVSIKEKKSFWLRIGRNGELKNMNIETYFLTDSREQKEMTFSTFNETEEMYI